MSKTSGEIRIYTGCAQSPGSISGKLIIKKAPDAHLRVQFLEEERSFFWFKYKVKVKYVYGPNGWQPEE